MDWIKLQLSLMACATELDAQGHANEASYIRIAVIPRMFEDAKSLGEKGDPSLLEVLE